MLIACALALLFLCGFAIAVYRSGCSENRFRESQPDDFIQRSDSVSCTGHGWKWIWN